MEQYILGLFDTRDEAEDAAAALAKADIPGVEFGIFGRHEDFRDGLDVDSEEEGIAKSAGIGAAAGGASGALVGLGVGASLFMVPGIGQAFAIGALATSIAAGLASTGIGAAFGGFMGALLGYGASEEDANFYVEGLKRGGALLVVQSDSAHAAEISGHLKEAGAINVERRRQEWLAEGWTGHVDDSDHA